MARQTRTATTMGAVEDDEDRDDNPRRERVRVELPDGRTLNVTRYDAERLYPGAPVSARPSAARNRRDSDPSFTFAEARNKARTAKSTKGDDAGDAGGAA